jgi:predicted RNA-binding protein associated with RNAse of E/G family
MADAVARIQYHRPPSRTDLFEQRVVHRNAERIITFMAATPVSHPVLVGGEVILEPGSPVIWFTYPGRLHDVGIFHDAAGHFTGYYANILTPVVFHSTLEWETTDLFLDVWLDRKGQAHLLDEAELAAAVKNGWVGREVATTATAEAGRLLDAIAAGDFPPADVRDWSLERVRAQLLAGRRHAAQPPGVTPRDRRGVDSN